MVKGLGADEVLDYNASDPLEQARAHAPFDAIIDSTGAYSGATCRSLLASRGRHVMVAGNTIGAMAQILVPPFRSRLILGKPTRARLAAVVAAVAAKQLVVNIAKSLPLVEVEAAHAMSETGRMTGKLVLLPRA